MDFMRQICRPNKTEVESLSIMSIICVALAQKMLSYDK